MYMNAREWWTVIHGMILGAIFLLAFAGALVELWTLRKEWMTEAETSHSIRRLRIGSWTMAIICWLTTISGTFLVYPWYRAKVPESPRSLLLASEQTAAWHTFGMEWKEHISWAAPLLATAAAFLIYYYGPRLIGRPWLRAGTLVMMVAAFGAAAVGGVFGAFLNSIAPII